MQTIFLSTVTTEFGPLRRRITKLNQPTTRRVVLPLLCDFRVLCVLMKRKHHDNRLSQRLG